MPLLTSTQYALLVKTGSTDDTLVEYLRDTYTGSVDDMFYQFLMDQGLSGSIQDMISQWDGTFGASIVLDVVPNVAHDAPVTTVVATASVSNGNGTYTFSLTNNASGQFTINTTTGVITVNGALTTGNQDITIEADNGVDTPVTLNTSVSVNIAPANSVAPVVSGTPEVGETLSTSNGTWSGHPAPTFTYQWQRGGVNISGATSSTYTLTDDDDSTNVDCDVTATNSSGSATAASNALSITYATPVFITPASISGTNVVGNTLTTDPGVASQPAGTTFTYQWTRDAVNIAAATSSTYTLVSADENTDVTCVVTATTNNPGTATATSTPTAVTVLYIAPTLNGSIANKTDLVVGTADTQDVSGSITGNGLTWSLDTAPAGVTISSVTGIISYPDTLPEQTGTAVTVRGANNGGFVTQSFTISVAAASGPWTPADDTGMASGSIVHWHDASDWLNTSDATPSSGQDLKSLASKGGLAGTGSPNEMDYLIKSGSNHAKYNLTNGVPWADFVPDGSNIIYEFEPKDIIGIEFWLLVKVTGTVRCTLFGHSSDIVQIGTSSLAPRIVGTPPIYGNALVSPTLLTSGTWHVIRAQLRSDGGFIEVDNVLVDTTTGSEGSIEVDWLGNYGGLTSRFIGGLAEDLTVLGTANATLEANLWAYFGAKRDTLNGV